MKKLAKQILMIIILFTALAYVLGKGIDSVTATETEKRCSVMLCTGNGNDIWEVTVVDTDGNLWAYYDDVPREIDSVVVCTFNRNEIVDVR